MKKLLDVDGRFLLSGRGLVLYPDFPLPPGGHTAFTESVLIRRPDGSRTEMQASFQTTHVRLRTGAGKWAVTVLLPDAKKEDVPVGSEVYCSVETHGWLAGEADGNGP